MKSFLNLIKLIFYYKLKIYYFKSFYGKMFINTNFKKFSIFQI